MCVFVLSLVPSLASADEPPPAESAQRRVEQGLVKPLAEQEGSRFSRSRPAPRERRVRVQPTASMDGSGRQFMTFAVDVRFGGQWHQNDVVGCVYTKSGDLYVKKGDAYRPAAFLLGKNAQPVAHVCEGTTARS